MHHGLWDKSPNFVGVSVRFLAWGWRCQLKNVDRKRQSIDQLCQLEGINILITKGLRFGEGIALFKASADFLSRIPKREPLETNFRGSLLLPLYPHISNPGRCAWKSPASPSSILRGCHQLRWLARHNRLISKLRRVGDPLATASSFLLLLITLWEPPKRESRFRRDSLYLF